MAWLLFPPTTFADPTESINATQDSPVTGRRIRNCIGA